MSENNLGGEAKEALGKMTGTPSKGVATEKGEPKTVRAAQHFFSDLQVLEKLMRDKDLPLEPVSPNQTALVRYGLVETSKGGVWNWIIHDQGGK